MMTPTTHANAPATEHEVRDIPVWLTAVVLLLCVAGGGWLIRWQLKQEKPGQLVTLPDDKLPPSIKNWKSSPANGPPAARASRAPAKTGDGVHEMAKRSWKVVAGKSLMHVNLGRKDEVEVSLNYANPLRTAEEAELAMVRMSVLNDPTWKDTLKITDDQVAKLKQVPVSLGMKVADPDKAKLTELFKKWQTATPGEKAAAERSLVTTLDQVGKTAEAATKQHEAERAQLIRTALTEAQLKTYREGGAAKP